jgi:hypothetical protein
MNYFTAVVGVHFMITITTGIIILAVVEVVAVRTTGVVNATAILTAATKHL